MFTKKDHRDDTRMALLRDVDLFRACSDAELRRLGSSWDPVTYPAGRVLVTEGERGSEAFVLASGAAAVTIGDQHIAGIGPGAVVGEMALLDNGTRAATVTLTTESELLVIAVREFRSLLDEMPNLTRQILTTLTRRLREVEGALTA